MGRALVVGSYCLLLSASAQTAVIYVDADATSGANDGSSWVDAFTDLQDAPAAATSGDEIWVAEGTYRPTTGTDRTISFQLVEGVAFYGGFSGTETSRGERDWTVYGTTLSGDIGAAGNKSDNSYHVVVAASNATLDGFTVSAGNADGSSPDDRGGGMYSSGAGGLAVVDCEFSGNTAGYGGGTYGVSPAGCSFSNNTAGRGGGMYGGSATDCTFSGNMATEDGGAMHGGSATSCTFRGNRASGFAGAIYDATSATNCTFLGNSAYDCAAVQGGVVTNCILWGGSSSWGDTLEVRGVHLSYSAIDQVIGWAISDGGGNISANPRLWTSSDGDLLLAPGSPCIDAADGDAAPALDKNGRPRYDDPDTPDTGVGAVTYADMGAHEYHGEKPPPSSDGGCAPGAGGTLAVAPLAFALAAALARRRRFA